MKKIYTLILFICIHVLSFSQYCTINGPTTLIDSNVQSVDLTGDTGSISFVGCPAVLGVQDLTNLTTALSAGNLYTVSIQFGTCDGNFAGNGEAWIDFNGDQIFTSDETIGTWTGTPPSALTNFTFTVPFGITNSTTRLRVMQQEASSLPLDPCASFSWGSVMDFSIELTGGIDCSGYIGNNELDPILVNSFPYTNIHNTSVCYSNNNFAYLSPDVYYLVIPNQNSNNLYISLCGSSFDTFLSVFDTDGNSITFNDDGTNCGSQSELTFSTVGLDSVYVIVEGWGTEKGEYEINMTETVLNVNSPHKQSIEIFPNPVFEKFRISNLSNIFVSIVDISGKTVKCIEVYNGEFIQINEFTKGVYFINYVLNEIPISTKLIIK